MSFFLPDKFKEEVASGETTFDPDHQDAAILDTLKSNESAVESTWIASASLLLGIDLQALASVLSFLALVAALCGWFDRWVTRNKAPTDQMRGFADAHWRAREDACGSFQSSFLGEGTTTSEQIDGSEDLDLPRMTRERARTSTDVTQAGANREIAAGGSSVTESSSRNLV